MSGFDLLIFALVVLFSIISWIYRTTRSLIAAARKSLGTGTVTTAEEARRQAWEQSRLQTSSQQAETRQTPARRGMMRARRPEAGGPAVTDSADSAQFRAQVAAIEAEEAPRLPAADATRADGVPTSGTLFGSRDDLVRAVILQEIFARPLSQRRRVIHHKEQPLVPPQ